MRRKIVEGLCEVEEEICRLHGFLWFKYVQGENRIDEAELTTILYILARLKKKIEELKKQIIEE